jgi:hypothetical protein
MIDKSASFACITALSCVTHQQHRLPTFTSALRKTTHRIRICLWHDWTSDKHHTHACLGCHESINAAKHTAGRYEVRQHAQNSRNTIHRGEQDGVTAGWCIGRWSMNARRMPALCKLTSHASYAPIRRHLMRSALTSQETAHRAGRTWLGS